MLWHSVPDVCRDIIENKKNRVCSRIFLQAYTLYQILHYVNEKDYFSKVTETD